MHDITHVKVRALNASHIIVGIKKYRWRQCVGRAVCSLSVLFKRRYQLLRLYSVKGS
jgi:hypothetical protein